MEFLKVESLTKKFGEVVALDDISLSIDSGKFVTLLGPSGCGKTTLLRAVSGLEQPNSGEIFLNNKCITDLPVNQRRMGLVVQNYALFPHMTVFENVAYGLRVRNIGGQELKKKVIEALDLVKLSGFEDRFPRQLSGGQQQRCALARALVIQPELLLLDEALGALDKNLRENMQVEIKQLQLNLGLTTLAVTHDQEEALGMSDQIVVMSNGRVEQVGTPTELYEKPHSEFVANFIGDANIFQGHVEQISTDGIAKVETMEGMSIAVSVYEDNFIKGDHVLVVVRPEKINLYRQRPENMANQFKGRVEAVVYQGNSSKLIIRISSEKTLTVRESHVLDNGEKSFQIDDKVWLTWQADITHMIRT